VVAMMGDKDRIASLANLVAGVDAWYLADLSDIPRAASLDMLAADLASLGQQATFAGTVEQCFTQLLQDSSSGDRIIICGSFYTVAAGLKLIQQA
jgi:dihydrofolate synthase / folylpolyglutamate synthase